MTIPELVREWKYTLHTSKRESLDQRWFSEADIERHCKEASDRNCALSRALDAKCEEAGISIYENQFCFSKAYAWQNEDQTGDEHTAYATCGDMPAADLHALLGYLLDKQR